MKKITTLILTLSITGLVAQTNPATPNSGFESWTHNSSGYDDPNNWNCLNPSTSALGFYTCLKDSTPADVHSGKYSAHLVTQSFVGQTIPGALTTGTINVTSQTISGGLPYTLRPDSIIAWYKYTSVSGDNADIEFYLFGANHTDTIGEAFFKTPTISVSTYTRLSLAITYRSSSAVDTALWILSSSINKAGGKVGSQLYADDLGLVFDTALAVQTITNPDQIIVGPNPARGFISVRNISNLRLLTFGLYDITGRKVTEENLIMGTSQVDVSAMPDGIYIYSIQDEHNAAVKTGRIVIQK